MIVKLNNEVLLKETNSFPGVYEDIYLSYRNSAIPKSIEDQYNCTRPIYVESAGQIIHCDSDAGSNYKIKNLQLKSFDFPDTKR